MQILKQSTAVDVLIGPFVDRTDGYTAEEGESPSVLLSKNGQALAAKNDGTTPTHDDAGYYNCELDATDTNTVGTLVVVVEASANALPVRHEFQVVEEAVYDALFAASASGFGTAQTGDCYARLGAPAGASVSADIAAVKSDTADILTDTGTTIPATLTTIDGIVDDILVDTGTTIPGTISTMQGNVTAILEDTGTTLPGTLSTIDGKVDTIDGIVDDILTDTAEIGAAGAGLTEAGGTGDQLTAVPWNASWDAEAQSECADALAAINLDHLMLTGDATLTNIVADNTALAHLMAIGADISDYDDSTDSLEAIAGAGGGGAPTVEQIRAEIDSNSTQLAAIVADTNELQTDWANGGRLDLIVDAILADTNELQTDDTPGTLTIIEGKIDTIDGIVDSILEDTGTTIPAALTTIDGIVDDILVDTGTTIPGTITTMQGNVTSILEDTGTTIPAAIADLPTNAELATALTTSWSTTTLTEDYPADGAAATPAELLYLILGCVSEFAISGTTITVKKIDGSSTAATYTLDDDTTPTSRTRAS